MSLDGGIVQSWLAVRVAVTKHVHEFRSSATLKVLLLHWLAELLQPALRTPFTANADTLVNPRARFDQKAWFNGDAAHAGG